MKKLGILFALIVVFINTNNVYALDNTLKVYDYAQILTSSEEEDLKEDVYKYIQNYNMDMVLVTVRHHFKNTTKDYALEFYDYNDFGIGNSKDGILFVIDFNFTNDDNYVDTYISLTGNATMVYNNYEIEKMLDDIALKKDKGYYEMFKEFIKTSNNYASIDYISNNYESNIINRTKNVSFMFNFILSIIVAFIVTFILISKNKTIKASANANYYINEKSIQITKRSNRYITTHTTSVRINDNQSNNHSNRSHSGGSNSSIRHSGGGRRI